MSRFTRPLTSYAPTSARPRPVRTFPPRRPLLLRPQPTLGEVPSMSISTSVDATSVDSLAVLDREHVGDIRGALGTIARGDVAARPRLSNKLKTLLAIVGPGLIVMVGDNDAGAFGTYTQAGQDYGTHLLWTLLLLVPVLYVNQEMVLRLGAVTGVGHAPSHPRAFRPVLGRFQRHRPLHVERADHRHRIHRGHPGRWLPGSAQGPVGDPGRCGRRGRGEHRELPALRAHLLRARCGVAAARSRST